MCLLNQLRRHTYRSQTSPLSNLTSSLHSLSIAMTYPDVPTVINVESKADISTNEKQNTDELQFTVDPFGDTFYDQSYFDYIDGRVRKKFMNFILFWFLLVSVAGTVFLISEYQGRLDSIEGARS